ncbi:hypothetical protein FACS1894120_1530 [Clostridia bacterium]|nr:hypothetical protein FACS1894120_1530 [Clostridia bacterium]
MEENANEKIAAFRDSVRLGIDGKISGVVEDAQRQSKIIIANAEDNLIQYSYDMISRKTKEIKTANSKRVAAVNAEGKRDVLMHRSTLIESFFDDIETKVREFVADKALYSDYLKKRLKLAGDEKPFYNWARILIRERDRSIVEPFIDEYDGLHIETDNGIRLGGFILFYPKEKQYLDKTLDKQLEYARSKFTYNTELHIR